MYSFVESPLATSLGGLAIARVFFDVRNHARIEDQLPIVCGIKAAIKVEVGASQVQTDLVGHLLQGVQTIRQENHIRFIDGSDREWGHHITIVVRNGQDFLALLVFVPRVPNAIAPFFATVLVPSPCNTLVSSCCAAARCRTLAMNACQSDPSSAHLAKVL